MFGTCNIRAWAVWIQCFLPHSAIGAAGTALEAAVCRRGHPTCQTGLDSCHVDAKLLLARCLAERNGVRHVKYTCLGCVDTVLSAAQRNGRGRYSSPSYIEQNDAFAPCQTEPD